MSKFSINLSDEDRSYLETQFTEGPTHGIRIAIEVLRRYQNGELVATTTPAGAGKSEDELRKERLAIEIEIKKHVRDMDNLDRDNAQADLDLKRERLRKLQWENDQRESQGPLRQIPKAPASPEAQAIEDELKKDIAKPEPRPKQESRVQELPAGKGVVGCDSCHAVFIFDNPDRALDDFVDHIITHGRSDISSNEANQFRHARKRITRSVTV